MSDAAICTIVAKNYIPFARVLCRSYLALHPDSHAFVLLADRCEGYLDQSEEPFSLLEAESLGIPDFESFAFKYDVVEFCTAMKPFFVDLLFERYGLKKILYLDPDILITGRLDRLFGLLDRHSILLTPHLTRPYADDKQPGELDILRTGAYNLGFIGLRLSPEVSELLAWWKARCYDGCVVRFEDSHFVDQRWIDLVPGLFPGVCVLRDPGYNVAYWNLHERNLRWGARPLSNGEPLDFFHFSGLKMSDVESISRYQDRYTLSDLPELRPLFAQYEKLLLENGYWECSEWPYAFGSFEDGARISPLARRAYHSLSSEERQRFGNPFSSRDGRSFAHWLRAPADLSAGARRRRRRGRRAALRRLWSFAARLLGREEPYVNNLMYFLHQSEARIRADFPDVAGRDRNAFLRWYLRKGGSRADLEPPRAGPAVGGNLRRKGSPLRARLLSRPGSVGVNIAGYFSTESGVGEGARMLVRAMDCARIPRELYNFDKSRHLPRGDDTFCDFSARNPHPVNIVRVNADQVPLFAEEVGKNYFRGRYNIGFWAWELPEFPERWSDRFSRFHEIWAPSSFSARAIAARAPVPVQRMSHSIHAVIERPLHRGQLGLPEDKFLFLFVFDFMSFFERKNPLAVIRAFRDAFGGLRHSGVMLAIKFSNGGHFPEEVARMKEEAADLPIELIGRQFTRNEVRNLLRLCDCYVSLHRSEGFGFTMAEAMVFAKPVIATGYSGNTDFMNATNSLLVGHRLTTIDEDVGPYERGQVWADPDVEQAARYMRFVVERRAEAEALGQRAREYIWGNLSPERIGERIRRRLELVLAAGKR